MKSMHLIEMRNTIGIKVMKGIVKMRKILVLILLTIFSGCSNKTEPVKNNDYSDTSSINTEVKKGGKEELKSAIVYLSRINNIESSSNFSLDGEDEEQNTKDIGNTESIAYLIQDVTHSEMFTIVVKNPYPDNYNEHIEQARREFDNNTLPALQDTIENLRDFDVIYLGYPIWLGEMPSPVRTFLSDNDLSNKTIAPFITSGGTTNISNTIQMITDYQPEAIVTDYLFRTTSQLSNVEPDLERWLKQINKDTKGQ